MPTTQPAAALLASIIPGAAVRTPMLNRSHTHKPARTVEGPFFAPVQVGVYQNPAAHGGVHRVETCECGAVRRVLVNGRHREITSWT